MAKDLASTLARKFKLHWRKTRESIFAGADVVAVAEKKLSGKSLNRFWNLVEISDSDIKKLRGIAKNPRVKEPGIYELLPSSLSRIHLVATLTPKELKAALKERQISPSMNRDEFLRWRNAKRNRLTESEDDSLPLISHTSLSDKFAGLVVPDDLSVSKASRLKGELASLARRYGGLIIYGGQEREVLAKARNELLHAIEREIACQIATYSNNTDPQEIERIENSLWQFQALDEGKPAPYQASHPSSVEHPNHPFSLSKNWNFKRLHAYARKRRLVTRYTPIADAPEMIEVGCLQLAKRYLEDPSYLSKHKKELQRIARSRAKGASLAKRLLKQIDCF
jgi:hypothetical protein